MLCDPAAAWDAAQRSTGPCTEHDDSCAGAPQARERQLKWGTLVGRNPVPQAAAAGQPDAPAEATEDVYALHCTKQYMVGRSRRSDIRIGHNAPMPYISSQHFKIYHAVRWPSVQLNGVSLSPNERAPFLEARLEDLSQNGTFINGKLVGRDKQVPLADGDKIELVFPQGRVPPQTNANSFPIFTYAAWRVETPSEDKLSGVVKLEDGTPSEDK